MISEVIAVFDIGKTNKKFLLFDRDHNIVLNEEVRFTEVYDEDGFLSEDISRIESWQRDCILNVIKDGRYHISAINFTTYGASLIYLDHNGKRLTPLYNYLKPLPENILNGFYEKYGGIDEFMRNTASPSLGMLNSGMQILWLKKAKPDIFNHIKYVLHLPQYLSYLLTRQVVSEYTSIGCHTALWDFDNHSYHKWTSDEGIILPSPIASDSSFPSRTLPLKIKVGIGIHDSSSSLVPFLLYSKKKFILISTGTWCVCMNPFNSEPLTIDELRQDILCYLGIRQQPVKSSRVFLGRFHDIIVEKICRYFNVEYDDIKKIRLDYSIIKSLCNSSKNNVFFIKRNSIWFVNEEANIEEFKSITEAYHRLIIDLVEIVIATMHLVLPKDDQTEDIYITGGFANNKIFVKLLSDYLPEKEVYISEVENATALGAALLVGSSSGISRSLTNLRLNRIK